MFMYYGSKGNVLKYYPKPKFSKIIEPFAGSAKYSFEYWEKEVLLVDKYEVIVNIWKYLQQASKNDILSLPKMKTGDSVNDFNISQIEKDFLGFIIFVCGTTPAKKMTKFNGGVQNQRLMLRRIANQLYKIKHWEIVLGDYKEIENEEATWFIDPPYQFGGEHYKESNKNLNFEELSNWCKSRKGQVMVCENTKATWMDFKPLAQMSGTRHKTVEAIWTNFDIYSQPKLFLT